MKYTAQPTADPLVYRELQKIGTALQGPEPQFVGLAKLEAAPAKPFDGMTVYADGTVWNPGGGEGVYTWYAAAWNRLG